MERSLAFGTIFVLNDIQNLVFGTSRGRSVKASMAFGTNFVLNDVEKMCAK